MKLFHYHHDYILIYYLLRLYEVHETALKLKLLQN